MQRALGPITTLLVVVALFAMASQPPSDARPSLTAVTRSPTTTATTQPPRPAGAPSPTIARAAAAPAIVVDPSPIDAAISERFEGAVSWLATAESPDAAISASVWVDGYGEVWSLNPERRLFPASNQKLLVAAGSFELLPAGHRFVTEVHAGSDPRTIIVSASGDPTATGESLDQLALNVVEARAGQPIDRLVIDPSRWIVAPTAPGWQDWQMPTYVGPLSTFTVDDNRWSTDAAFVSAPDRGNGERLADALRDAGANGDLRVVVGPGAPTGQAIATVRSPDRDELIEAMLLSSDNQIAEALVREIDVVGGGAGETAQGLRRITTALTSSGYRTDGIDGDGSGLSRHNLRSAREWQELLVSLRSAPWFEAYAGALPVAGRSGTLAGRLDTPPALDNVRAKTGTIIGGRALSGYLTLASGEAAVFSIVVNGESSADMLDEIDRFVADLATVELADP